MADYELTTGPGTTTAMMEREVRNAVPFHGDGDEIEEPREEERHGFYRGR